MYDTFYNLRHPPFKLTPDPRYFFESYTHKRACAYLRYAFQLGKGFVVVIGGPGTGKTELMLKIMQDLPTEQEVFPQIISSQYESNEVIEWVAASFQFATQGQSKDALQKKVQDLLTVHAQAGRRVLLLVDDAHRLNTNSFSELLDLSNLQLHDKPVVQCFLLGQDPLRKTLTEPASARFKQHVIASAHLNPIEKREIQQYVEHRLRCAGWQGDPNFSAAAYQLIHWFSRGIPRQINSLCNRILMYGSLHEKHEINDALVRTVISETMEEPASQGANQVGYGGNESQQFHKMPEFAVEEPYKRKPEYKLNTPSPSGPNSILRQNANAYCKVPLSHYVATVERWNDHSPGAVVSKFGHGSANPVLTPRGNEIALQEPLANTGSDAYDQKYTVIDSREQKTTIPDPQSSAESVLAKQSPQIKPDELVEPIASILADPTVNGVLSDTAEPTTGSMDPLVSAVLRGSRASAAITDVKRPLHKHTDARGKRARFTRHRSLAFIPTRLRRWHIALAAVLVFVLAFVVNVVQRNSHFTQALNSSHIDNDTKPLTVLSQNETVEATPEDRNMVRHSPSASSASLPAAHLDSSPAPQDGTKKSQPKKEQPPSFSTPLAGLVSLEDNKNHTPRAPPIAGQSINGSTRTDSPAQAPSTRISNTLALRQTKEPGIAELPADEPISGNPLAAAVESERRTIADNPVKTTSVKPALLIAAPAAVLPQLPGETPVNQPADAPNNAEKSPNPSLGGEVAVKDGVKTNVPALATAEQSHNMRFQNNNSSTAGVKLQTPPSISEAELNILLFKFTSTYESGNLAQLVSTLDRDVQSNEANGRQEIEADYRKLFNVTDMRRMFIHGVRWVINGSQIQGKGNFQVYIREKGANQVRTYDGSVSFEVAQNSGNFSFTRLDYHYDN